MSPKVQSDLFCVRWDVNSVNQTVHVQMKNDT